MKTMHSLPFMHFQSHNRLQNKSITSVLLTKAGTKSKDIPGVMDGDFHDAANVSTKMRHPRLEIRTAVVFGP